MDFLCLVDTPLWVSSISLNQGKGKNSKEEESCEIERNDKAKRKKKRQKGNGIQRDVTELKVCVLSATLFAHSYIGRRHLLMAENCFTSLSLSILLMNNS